MPSQEELGSVFDIINLAHIKCTHLPATIRIVDTIITDTTKIKGIIGDDMEIY